MKPDPEKAAPLPSPTDTTGFAIKMHCRFDCLGGASMREVIACQNTACFLWSRRAGHNPKRQGRGKSPSQPRNAQNGRFTPSYDGPREKVRKIRDGDKVILQAPDGKTLVEVRVIEERAKP